MFHRNSANARKPFKPPTRTSDAAASESSGVTRSQPSQKSQLHQVNSSSRQSSAPASFSTDNMENLKAKEAQLDEDIAKLREKGHKPEELQEYINLLHEYNEAKDIAQMFMGRLAVYDCSTYREMARRYNAPESD